jgi:hypothetical protein
MIIKILTASLYLSLVFGLAGCAKPEEVSKEESPRSIEAGNPPVVEVQVRTDLPQPTVDEVRVIIERNFHDAVTVNASGRKGFFTGDFNGDGSQDIAVLVIPVKGKLADINSPVANWIIADPVALAMRSKEAGPDPGSPKPSVTEQDGALLAVIHGYGAQGWRDPEARQAYLLKNATGEQVRAATQGEMAQAARSGGALPHLYGDVIREKLAGESGFIYYTGASYEWFTPRAYRREPAKRMVHGGAS